MSETNEQKPKDPTVLTIYVKSANKDKSIPPIWWLDVRMGKYGLYATVNQDSKAKGLNWEKLKEKLGNRTMFLNVNQRVEMDVHLDKPKQKRQFAAKAESNPADVFAAGALSSGIEEDNDDF